MKTYVLMISKKFPSNLYCAGEPTFFIERIKAGWKKHTIRGNYDLWKKRVDEINKGNAILSLREWSDKPYKSSQVELMQLSKVGIQKLVLQPPHIIIEGIESEVGLKQLSLNDGLEVYPFYKWFEKSWLKELAIIHFTPFRY